MVTFNHSYLHKGSDLLDMVVELRVQYCRAYFSNHLRPIGCLYGVYNQYDKAKLNWLKCFKGTHEYLGVTKAKQIRNFFSNKDSFYFSIF